MPFQNPIWMCQPVLYCPKILAQSFITVVNWVSQLCPFLNDRSLYSSRWAMIFEHTMCSSNLQGTLAKYTSQGHRVIIACKWPVTLLEKGANYESMRKDTLEFAKEKYFNGYLDSRSVQEIFDLLTPFIEDSADKYIPSKTNRSVSSVPWITPDIRRKIRRKNKTHAKAKKTGSS